MMLQSYLYDLENESRYNWWLVFTQDIDLEYQNQFSMKAISFLRKKKGISFSI